MEPVCVACDCVLSCSNNQNYSRKNMEEKKSQQRVEEGKGQLRSSPS